MNITKQLPALLIVSLALIPLTIQVSKAAEFKQNVFITDNKYPFLKNPLFQKQFSQTGTKEFVQWSQDIRKQAKAIILDYTMYKVVSSEAKTQLRNLLVGEEERKVFFVLGYGVTPNFIQKYLDVSTKSVVEIMEKARTHLYATGLYNIGIHSDGPFLHVNMVSYEKISYENQVKSIYQTIEKIVKMHAEKPSPPHWRRINVYWFRYDSKICGKYNQAVDVQKMENDGSIKYDYWMAKVTNESVSGIQAHKNDYRNNNNNTKLDMDNPPQKIITYGPGGGISEDNTGTVTIGTTGPAVSWSWPTGKTSLRNLSDTSKGYCRWDVAYNRNGEEAASTYTWYPGLETRNPEKDTFRLKIINNLKWKQLMATKPFSYDWRIQVEP